MKKREKLVRARIKKGLSQQIAAELMGVSRNTWSLWELGKEDPYPLNVGELCKFFGVKDPNELDLEPRQLRTENAKAGTTSLTPLSPVSAVIPQEVPFPEVGGSGSSLAHSVQCSQTQHSAKTDVCQRSDDFSLTTHLTDLEVVERFVRALKKPSSIDEIFLTHIEAATTNNRKRFVLSKNSAQDIHSLHQDVSSHLLMITQILENPLPTRISLHLCVLAGETAQLLGDLCFHEGTNDTANLYYDTAIRAAIEAQNEVLQAVILGRRSFLPMYSGNASLALSFLQEAHKLAARNASDVIRAWLAVVEAEAQAMISDVEACHKALQKSEFLLHQSHSGYTTCSFPSETMYAPLNTQRLLGYKGACHLSLRQPQKAQAILHSYMASMDYPSLHKQSITLVDLARAYALQEEMEEMYTYVDQAIRLLEQTRSTRVFQRIYNLRQGLHHWQDTVYIKQLDQQLAAISLSFVREEMLVQER